MQSRTVSFAVNEETEKSIRDIQQYANTQGISVSHFFRKAINEFAKKLNTDSNSIRKK